MNYDMNARQLLTILTGDKHNDLLSIMRHFFLCFTTIEKEILMLKQK